MQRLINTILAALLLLSFNKPAFSQDFRISNYGVSEGIIHPFVYTVNQDTRGFIWIGTGEGICRFDGFEFNTSMVHDSLTGKLANISYKDSRGTLWFGYSGGEIARYDGTKFEIVTLGVEINGSITGFKEINDDILLVATLNNGLFS